jgi:hypothetical protein
LHPCTSASTVSIRSLRAIGDRCPLDKAPTSFCNPANLQGKARLLDEGPILVKGQEPRSRTNDPSRCRNAFDDLTSVHIGERFSSRERDRVEQPHLSQGYTRSRSTILDVKERD